MRILAIVLKKSQTFSQDRTTQKVRFLSCPRYVAHTGVGRVVKNGPELNLSPLNSEFPLLRKERIIRTNSNHEGISIVLVSNPHGENFRVKLRVTLTKRIINFWLSLSPLFFFFIVKSSTRESYDGFAEEEKDSKTQIKINGPEKPTPNKTQVSIDARSPSNHQEPAKKTPVWVVFVVGYCRNYYDLLVRHSKQPHWTTSQNGRNLGGCSVWFVFFWVKMSASFLRSASYFRL